MFIGKVTGHLVATQKEAAMADSKLLVVEAYSGAGPGEAALQPTGKVLIAVDSLGAGTGEYVLVTQGSSARMTDQTKNDAGRRGRHRHRRQPARGAGGDVGGG
jgi:ethanolamine utilization protein EutN